MPDGNLHLCPDDQMSGVLATLQTNDDAGLAQMSRLMMQYPNDPRLHFLNGSVLAGLQRYEEGLLSMRRAIEIAPAFELARFQLGFLELTSGMAEAAVQTWTPFEDLPEDAPFRLLSAGLTCLARDQFAECAHYLKAGMKANTEHPLINGDMQLILDEIADKITTDAPPVAQVDETASAAHQLLQQFELKDSASKTRH